jgi:hypothetical protein
MDPPVNEKDFSKMSKKEAEKVFEWYTKEIPHRLSLLKKAYLLCDGNTDIFDYSSDSLKPLWSWYLKNVKIVLINEDKRQKIQEQIDNYPTHIRAECLVPENKIEAVWVQIAFDIGIYMSLCLMKAKKNLDWGIVFEPQNLYSVNRPVIVGFAKKNIHFDSMNIMTTLMHQIIKSKASCEKMYDYFMSWAVKP